MSIQTLSIGEISDKDIWRFIRKIAVGDDCWEWTAAKVSNGYGAFFLNGRMHVSHRISYEIFVGPIPDGLELDHVRDRGCLSVSCVNPRHLEPVTHQENVRRSGSLAGLNASKTHCKNGHEFDEENTYINRQGGRVCKPCRRAWDRRVYHSKKEATVNTETKA